MSVATVHWEGGPHDGCVQLLYSLAPGEELPEWRTCACHGVAYRYVGIVDDVHLLVAASDRVEAAAALNRSVA